MRYYYTPTKLEQLSEYPNKCGKEAKEQEISEGWLECKSRQTFVSPTIKQVPFLVSILEKLFYWSLRYKSVHCPTVSKSQKAETVEISIVRKMNKYRTYI